MISFFPGMDHSLLDLADDLAGAAQALHHLLAFLSSADCVVAFLE